MITKKVKTKRLKGEKFVIFAIVMLAIATPLFSVFTQAKLSESNIALEKIEKFGKDLQSNGLNVLSPTPEDQNYLTILT